MRIVALFFSTCLFGGLFVHLKYVCFGLLFVCLLVLVCLFIGYSVSVYWFVACLFITYLFIICAVNVQLSLEETYADVVPVRINPGSPTAFV